MLLCCRRKLCYFVCALVKCWSSICVFFVNNPFILFYCCSYRLFCHQALATLVMNSTSLTWFLKTHCFFFLFFLVLLFIHVIFKFYMFLLCWWMFFELFQQAVLPNLIPMKINMRIIWIGFFYDPPGPIASKNTFDKRTMISFANIENVRLVELGTWNFNIIWNVNQRKKTHILLVLL